jgi:hypothetical protein
LEVISGARRHSFIKFSASSCGIYSQSSQFCSVMAVKECLAVAFGQP